MGEQDTRRELSCGRCNSIDRRDFMGVFGLSALGLAPALTQLSEAPPRWVPAEGPNKPTGEAKGIFPGRVVWMHDRNVAKWDGDAESGGWWEDKCTDPVLADRMLSNSLRLLTGVKSDPDAWAALFGHYNQTHGRGNAGYRPGEKVLVKLNMNCSSRRDRPSLGLYNTPQLTKALLRQLVKQAGVRESDIVVSDASRLTNDPIFTTCHTEFPNIGFEDRDGIQGRLKARPDKEDALHFGTPGTALLSTTPR